MRNILNVLIIAGYIYFKIGVLYWFATLKNSPYAQGRWFPNPRSLKVIFTWGVEIARWRKRRGICS